MKKLILYLNVATLIFISAHFYFSKSEARPWPDRIGICYVFEGQKIQKTVPCVISTGYGAGAMYTNLSWPDGKSNQIITCTDTNCPNNYTLDDKPAETYTLDGTWYKPVQDGRTGDELDNPADDVQCVRVKGSQVSYCYRFTD